VSRSWNLENDTTHGQTDSTIYTATDHQSGPTRPTRATSLRGFWRGCRACRRGCHEYAMRMLQGSCFRGIAASCVYTYESHSHRAAISASLCIVSAADLGRSTDTGSRCLSGVSWIRCDGRVGAQNPAQMMIIRHTKKTRNIITQPRLEYTSCSLRIKMSAKIIVRSLSLSGFVQFQCELKN